MFDVEIVAIVKCENTLANAFVFSLFVFSLDNCQPILFMEVIFEDKSKKQLVMFLRKHLGQLGPSASSNDKHRYLFFGFEFS